MLEGLFELSAHLIKIHTREFRRYLYAELSLDLPCSILTGQRGVGKTTLLTQKIIEHSSDYLSSKEVLYIPCDHVLFKPHTLYDLAEEFALLGGKLLCLDEIHRYPEWSQELKSILDTFPGLHVVGSGSSALQIQRASHDLSRRAVMRELFGLSFREYLELEYGLKLPALSLKELTAKHVELCTQIVDTVAKLELKIIAAFRDYLKHGYFPYYRDYRQVANFHLTLKQNIDRTLDSDLLSAYPALSGVSLRKIRQLLALIAGSVPFQPNLSRMTAQLDIGDQRTLKEYLNYLQKGRLIRLLSKYGSIAGNLGAIEKIYLDNPNLAVVLSVPGRDDPGNLRETFFLTCLAGNYSVTAAKQGDFNVDAEFTFEVGGRNKSATQIHALKKAFLVLDNIEVGSAQRIPLWLFGFLY